MITGIGQKLDPDNEISNNNLIILVTCGLNCNLSIWDFYKNDPLAEINLNERFYSLKVSNSGNYICLGSEIGEIWIFIIPEFEFIGKSQGHSSSVVNLRWSPDDKQIISVSDDDSVCIWNFYRI